MWSSRRSRLGVTLIEVLVAGSIAVVAFGLIMGLLTQTRQATIDGHDRLTMQSHAQQIAEEVVAVLDAAVPPGSLDTGLTSAPLHCEPHRCTVVSSQGFDGRDFYAFTIANEHKEIVSEAEDSKEVDVVILSTQAFDPQRMSPVVREKTRNLGIAGDRFAAAISFEYSAVSVGGINPPLVDRLEPGRYPVLVQLRVTVRDTMQKLPPYEFITAVRM